MPGKNSTDEKIKLSAEIALLTGTILRIVWGKKLVISLLDFQQEWRNQWATLEFVNSRQHCHNDNSCGFSLRNINTFSQARKTNILNTKHSETTEAVFDN